MAVIEAENITVRYGDLVALKNFSCRVDGGAVGLLGPNGAGKSTFMKTLLGFVKPHSGSVSVFGLPMPRDFLQVRQQLGYMPEREVIAPKMSAVSFLTLCGELCGMTRVDAMERAHEVLNYVGMGENRYRPTETYSTGMLQRVKFAAALIHDPKLLLLDEPTNGLDPTGRQEMLDLIKDLPNKREITLVLSSHLLPDVEYVCDRLIMIGRGVLLKEGMLEALTAVKEGLYEVRVRENPGGYVAALERAGCILRHEDHGTLFIAKPTALPERVFFEAARDQGTQVRHLQARRYSLEEAFLEALGKKAG